MKPHTVRRGLVFITSVLPEGAQPAVKNYSLWKANWQQMKDDMQRNKPPPQVPSLVKGPVCLHIWFKAPSVGPVQLLGLH